MRKLLVGETAGPGGPVRYYLLAETLANGTETYGVQVERGPASASAPDLTASQRRVEALLRRLMDGAVAPAAVTDVVEDWLLE